MLKPVISSFLSLLLVVSAQAVQSPQEPKSKEAAPAPARPAPQRINPADFNIRIGPDERMFLAMAAINMAGFDYEPGGQPLTPARAELRRDLAKMDAGLRAELAAYYRQHRREGVEESSDAARFAALSLLMTAPPGFSIYASATPETDGRGAVVPQDLRPLLGFSDLLRKFYGSSGVRELIPKYMAVGEAYAKAYQPAVGELIYQVYDYLQARPETEIHERPIVINEEGKGAKAKQRVVARTRTRTLYLIPDPLSAMDSAFIRDDLLNQKVDDVTRRPGDDYVVILGPSRTPNDEAIRRALIRFTIDPIVERHLRAALQYKEEISKLVASVPTAAKEFGPSVYLVVRESLASAAAARMRRLQAQRTGGTYGDDDVTYDLAQAYQRGAVLAFHFYESLKGFEQVGISLDSFVERMVETTKFDREALRPAEFGPLLARVAERRRTAAASPAAEPLKAVVAEKILLSDDLIRGRRFKEARPVLEEILRLEPKNARALFGLAQITNQSPSPVEEDPNADENDKIQAQYDRFKKAMDLYRRAIENASPESEKWLIQWSHVFIGRILDFQEFRGDAIAEYDKALALGDIPNGAYKEALAGKARPHGQ